MDLTSKVHYRKALEIHSQNAVLLGCMGMANRFRPRVLIRGLLVAEVRFTVGVSPIVERRGDNVAAYRFFFFTY